MNSQVPPLQGLRCPDCKSRLETSVEIKEFPITCERVYIHIYKCPKCNYVFKRHRKTPTLELSIKRMLARVTGSIGERIAYKVIVKRGFEVISFQDLVSELGPHYKTFTYDRFSEQYLKEFFDEKHLKNFINYCRAWTEDSDIPSGKIRKIETDNYEVRSPAFGPDWIGRKDNKFYFIEVKTNTAVLQNYQKKMLLKAKDFGFIPLIIRVKVDVKVPLEEVRIEEL